jgi:hypothetical protein
MMSFVPLIPVTTMAGRIGVILLACVFLIIFLALAKRRGDAFFRGFVVAIGTFLSFDMVLMHWVFRLHRLTSGPEADVIEPVFTILGVVFIVYGLRSSTPRSGHPVDPTAGVVLRP